MTIRTERALKGLILVGLALFLTQKLIDGTLLFYINRRFAWLTWIATILLALMSYVYGRATHKRKDPHDHAAHPHTGSIPGTTLLLVALPLILGLLVPPRPLGAQAVGNREVNTASLGRGKEEVLSTRAAQERNILDWLQAFGAVQDPSAFAGQAASVVGFVYRDDSFAQDRFLVSRFVMTCCVADATPIGLLVSWPGSQDLAVDTWVQVEGVFEPGPFDDVNDSPTPILVADRVTPVQPPNQPYLYP